MPTSIFEALAMIIANFGAFIGGLSEVLFYDILSIPGAGSLSVFSLLFNPVNFVILFVAVVAKKVIPLI